MSGICILIQAMIIKIKCFFLSEDIYITICDISVFGKGTCLENILNILNY